MTSYNFNLLAIGAHPDDVEISCGGLLIKSAKKGYKTAAVDLTQGEMGTRGSVSVRAKETAKASKILGLKHRENLKLPDCGLDQAGQVDLTDADSSQLSRVVEMLRRLRPEIVMVHFNMCRHPDHIAASQLVSKAIFYAALRKYRVAGQKKSAGDVYVPRQFLLYQTRYEFRPSFVVDISEVFAQKLKAIDAYGSQIGTDRKYKHEPQTILSSASNRDLFELRARQYGAMIGTTYAEPYLMRNLLKLDDPVEHFSKTLSDATLIYPEVL